MKATQMEWARTYRTALRSHLAQGPRASLQPALALGHRAAALALTPLDLARMHAQALLHVPATPPGPAALRTHQQHARRFFEETLVPIERTHPAARKADRHVHRLTRTLRERTAESSLSARDLKRGIARRLAAESALRKSAQHCAAVLRESRRLQNLLSARARTALSRQETHSRLNSRRLQDEIVQGLIGIHVRLLVLKKMIVTSASSIRTEIGSTRRLVRQSTRSVKQFASELTHETNA